MNARMDGMRESAEHAGPDWQYQALQAIHEYAKTNTGFLIEAVRAFAAKRGDDSPPDAKAWGAVTKEAAKLGFIEREGYSAVGTNNASPKPVWKSLILKGDHALSTQYPQEKHHG